MLEYEDVARLYKNTFYKFVKRKRTKKYAKNPCGRDDFCYSLFMTNEITIEEFIKILSGFPKDAVVRVACEKTRHWQTSVQFETITKDNVNNFVYFNPASNKLDIGGN